MSHEITAISYTSGEKISEIVLESNCQGRSWLFYESLDCSEYNSGFCGNGNSIILDREKIKTSLSKFYYLKGESNTDIICHINSYRPFQKYCSILSKIFKRTGINPRYASTSFDINKNLDIENFLISIQKDESVIICFR